MSEKWGRINGMDICSENDFYEFLKAQYGASIIPIYSRVVLEIGQEACDNCIFYREVYEDDRK